MIEGKKSGGRSLYSLTPLGERVGAACVPLVEQIGGTDVLPIALKKWPMLVVVALGRGARRYSEARSALPGITARALAIALKDLQAVGMLERTVENGYPPTPSYELTAKGMALFPALDALCRAADEATSELQGADATTET